MGRFIIHLFVCLSVLFLRGLDVKSLLFSVILIMGLVGCATKPELKWYEQIDARTVTSAYFFEFTNKDPHTEGNTFCAGFEEDDPNFCEKDCHVIRAINKITVNTEQVQAWVAEITDPKNVADNFPFIGYLDGGILFFNGRQEPLFAVKILRFDSLVRLHPIHINKNGDVVMRYEDDIFDNWSRDKTFVTDIYNYLKAYHPERLERNEEFFRRVNLDFREILINGGEVSGWAK